MKFNRLIPELSVSNLQKSLEFYLNTLGFKVEYRRDEAKFIFLSLQSTQLMLEEHNGNWETGPLEHPLGRGINFQIEVDQIAPLVQALSKAGYPLMIEPKESWYRVGQQSRGQLEFLVQDPDGYLLRFCEILSNPPEQLP